MPLLCGLLELHHLWSKSSQRQSTTLLYHSQTLLSATTQDIAAQLGNSSSCFLHCSSWISVNHRAYAQWSTSQGWKETFAFSWWCVTQGRKGICTSHRWLYPKHKMTWCKNRCTRCRVGIKQENYDITISPQNDFKGVYLITQPLVKPMTLAIMMHQ